MEFVVEVVSVPAVVDEVVVEAAVEAVEAVEAAPPKFMPMPTLGKPMVL